MNMVSLQSSLLMRWRGEAGSFLSLVWSQPEDRFTSHLKVEGSYETFPKLKWCKVLSLWDLMPDDPRWSWCNNNRNKVHNKYNALESSWNHTLPSPWKNCLPWNWSLVAERLGIVGVKWRSSYPGMHKMHQYNTQMLPIQSHDGLMLRCLAGTWRCYSYCLGCELAL